MFFSVLSVIRYFAHRTFFSVLSVKAETKACSEHVWTRRTQSVQDIEWKSEREHVELKIFMFFLNFKFLVASLKPL